MEGLIKDIYLTLNKIRNNTKLYSMNVKFSSEDYVNTYVFIATPNSMSYKSNIFATRKDFTSVMQVDLTILFQTKHA